MVRRFLVGAMLAVLLAAPAARADERSRALELYKVMTEAEEAAWPPFIAWATGQELPGKASERMTVIGDTLDRVRIPVQEESSDECDYAAFLLAITVSMLANDAGSEFNRKAGDDAHASKRTLEDLREYYKARRTCEKKLKIKPGVNALGIELLGLK